MEEGGGGTGGRKSSRLNQKVRLVGSTSGQDSTSTTDRQDRTHAHTTHHNWNLLLHVHSMYSTATTCRLNEAKRLQKKRLYARSPLPIPTVPVLVPPLGPCAAAIPPRASTARYPRKTLLRDNKPHLTAASTVRTGQLAHMQVQDDNDNFVALTAHVLRRLQANVHPVLTQT